MQALDRESGLDRPSSAPSALPPHNVGRRSHPLEAHVFTFVFYGPDDRRTGQLAAVVVRGRVGANGAIPTAYERAAALGPGPYCVNIQTCPSRSLPEHSPRLDRICAEQTAFPRFLDLLIAVAGYRPSIRLDLMESNGAVLAHTYDRAQARRGDPRRAFVTGEISDSQDIEACRYPGSPREQIA